MGWVVGAVINVIGSIMINLGTNVTKLGHNQTAAALPDESPKLLKHPRLWLAFPGKKWFLCGMSVFGIGNVLNFASFGFAAQSLLAALGVVQFLSNMVFARFLNNEHITKRVMFATALVVTGCILLVSFGNHESPIITAHDLLDLYSEGPYIAYLVVMATIVCTAYYIYRRGKNKIGGLKTQRVIHGKWGRWLPVCYALFSGVLGTQSVLYGKALSMLLRTTLTGDSQLGFWYTWLSLALFIFFAAFWLTRYSKALRLFPVSIIMPILQIVWVLFSIVSGSLYYQEYKTMTVLSGIMFAVGVIVLLVGIAFLTGGRRPNEPEAFADELEEELVEVDGGSLDTTPTAGKLLAETAPSEGTVREKYSFASSQESERPGGGKQGRHGRQPSDDDALRLFSGESSSATVWDNAQAMEAGEAGQQPAPAPASKRPVLRVVVESGAGEEPQPTPAGQQQQQHHHNQQQQRATSPRDSKPHSMLEDNDMDFSLRQLAAGYMGLDYLNPLSPAFTSFSMPLVPAVTSTPRVLSRTSLSLSRRSSRLSPLPPPNRSGMPPRPKHRIQRSRSAGELSEMMLKAAAAAEAEAAAAAAAKRDGGATLHPSPGPPSAQSLPPRQTPFDSPIPSPASTASPALPHSTGFLGRPLGGSAPRSGGLGMGGARRSWSVMSDRGTPAPTLALSTGTVDSSGEGLELDAPNSTSSSRPPRKDNLLSPRAFLEPLSPRSEEQGKEDLRQVVKKASSGKHE